MPTKSVKIPSYLKQKMSEHKEANWSEVMRNSIYEHLSRFEKKPEMEEAPTKTTEKEGSFAILGGLDSRKVYLLFGVVGIFILIAFWQYVLIGGLLAGLIYLKMRRRD